MHYLKFQIPTAYGLIFLGKNDLNFTYAYPYIRLNTLVRMAFNFLLFFFVNGTIFLYFMYRGLVKMEPITEPHSSESKQFHKSFRAARKDFNRHNFASARGRLDHCLQAWVIKLFLFRKFKIFEKSSDRFRF